MAELKVTRRPITTAGMFDFLRKSICSLSEFEYIDAYAYLDVLEAQVAALKAENERLKAPFTERDVDKLYFVISMFYEDVNKPSREEVVATMNAMLQERAATPAIHPACDHEWRIDTGGECPKCRKERE